MNDNHDILELIESKKNNGDKVRVIKSKDNIRHINIEGDTVIFELTIEEYEAYFEQNRREEQKLYRDISESIALGNSRHDPNSYENWKRKYKVDTVDTVPVSNESKKTGNKKKRKGIFSIFK